MQAFVNQQYSCICKESTGQNISENNESITAYLKNVVSEKLSFPLCLFMDNHFYQILHLLFWSKY